MNRIFRGVNQPGNEIYNNGLRILICPGQNASRNRLLRRRGLKFHQGVVIIRNGNGVAETGFLRIEFKTLRVDVHIQYFGLRQTDFNEMQFVVLADGDFGKIDTRCYNAVIACQITGLGNTEFQFIKQFFDADYAAEYEPVYGIYNV